jgi:hypothetical protein
MDIKVTHLRRVLPVSKTLDVPGPPHEFYISGPLAREVADVEINGVRGYVFRVVNSTTIAVTLPKAFNVKTLAILSTELGDAREAEVFFGFTPHISLVSGVQALAQYWLKCFLSSPGADAFSRSWGGAGRGAISKTFQQEGDFNSNIAIAVRRTNRQVMSRQASALYLPRNERLLDAKLIRAARKSNSETYEVDIEITNQAREVVRAGVA